MPDQDCDVIRDELAAYPNNKLGFVIYRLTYKDDAEWARFMEYLNKCTRQGLENDDEGALFKHIDWSVQEDPTLEGATMPQVRK